MNEVLRAKRLTEEILQRAASIKQHMNAVNERMANMQLIEDRQVQQAAALLVPRLKLMDLPDDCLSAVVLAVRQHNALCALAQTCTKFQFLVYNDFKGWEMRCREDWGICEPEPDLVPRLETGLLANLPGAGTAYGVNMEPASAPLEDELLGPLQGAASPTQQRRSSSGGGALTSPPRPSGCGALTSPPRPSGSGGDALTSPTRGSGTLTSPPRPSSSGGGPADFTSLIMDLGLDERGSRGSAGSSGSGSRAVAAAAAWAHACSPGRASVRWRAGAAGSGIAGRMRLSGGAGVSAANALASPGNLWRLIYRDRVQGWQLVMQLLLWLRNHGHPRSVTGSVHRLQLALALRYMLLGTGQPQDQPRKHQILSSEGLRSLLSLLDNESGQVVEMALGVMANLMQGDADIKIQLLIGSRMGKLFTDKLDQGGKQTPAVVQAAARALATMWSHDGPVPEVCLLDAFNCAAQPDLQPGLWQLQEYTLRGERMTLVHIFLSFESGEGSTIRVSGAGLDSSGDSRPEEFEVSGSLDPLSGVWTWQRRFLNEQQTILYRGYSDASGSYGVYSSKRADGSAASFIVSTSRQPRIYRLYRDTPTDAPSEP